MKLRSLIPFHVLEQYERIGSRWGLIIRRDWNRTSGIELVLHVTMPWLREFQDIFRNEMVIRRPQYFASFVWDIPIYKSDRHMLSARYGCQMREE